MSAKDYALIAATIATLGDDRLIDAYAHRRAAEVFADRLAPTNPLFDRARFLKACGVES